MKRRSIIALVGVIAICLFSGFGVGLVVGGKATKERLLEWRPHDSGVYQLGGRYHCALAGRHICTCEQNSMDPTFLSLWGMAP